MNFNQGQQYPLRKVPMLPPQLQNLSPQELQALKNQPQFQNAMRQYYQRQQMAPPQQQMRGMPPGQTGQNPIQGAAQPGVASMGNMANMGNMGNMAMPPGGGMPPNASMPANTAMSTNAPMQAPLHMPMPVAPPQGLAMYDRGAQQAYLQQKARPGGPRAPIQHPAGAAVPRPTPPQPHVRPDAAAGAMAQKYGLKAPGDPERPVPPAAHAGGAVVRAPTPDPEISAAAARMAATEAPSVPLRFAADAAAQFRPRRLRSATQWSETLRARGDSVPADLKVYEETITRDERYVRHAAAQGARQQHGVQRMAHDLKTYGGIKQLRMNAIGASAKSQYNNSIWGEGYQGYGNGVSNTATQVVMPHQNKSFTKVAGPPLTEAQTNNAVVTRLNNDRGHHLVPVRLDFDAERDRFKLRDTFLWDADDNTYPLENFVRTLVEDYKFILEQHVHTVLAVVTDQIKDYRRTPSKCMGEIRVPIRIDLVINNTQFTDQFEWDILNAGVSDPEDFATVVCDELALPGEFATAIAFSIREQAQLYHKALFLVGYSFDGLAIREDEIRTHLLPSLRVLDTDHAAEDFVSTLRNPALVADFLPLLTKLTQLEIEKIDKEMERELRRRRRHFNSENNFSYNENAPQFGRGTASRRSALHLGRGVKTTLPDLLDIPKNFRTPMPSSVLPGGIDLGVPDVYGYNELIINRAQIKNPDYRPPAPPGMVTSFRDSTGLFYVKIRFLRRR